MKSEAIHFLPIKMILWNTKEGSNKKNIFLEEGQNIDKEMRKSFELMAGFKKEREKAKGKM